LPVLESLLQPIAIAKSASAMASVVVTARVLLREGILSFMFYNSSP
jgi:hypothetical protein